MPKKAKSEPAKKSAGKVNALAAIEEILAAPTLPFAILILASDRNRPSRAIESILTHSSLSKKQSFPRFHGQSFDSTELQKLSGELNTGSLFAANSLAYLKSLEELDANLSSKLAEVIKELQSGACLLMSGTNLAKTSPLYKAIQKNGTIIEFEELNEQSAANYIEQELKNAGLLCPADVRKALQLRAIDNLDEACILIEQLALYSEDGQIKSQEFFQLFPSLPNENEFALIDLLNNQACGSVEATLQLLFSQGKNAFALLSLLNRVFNTHYDIKLLQSQGRTASEIQELLAVKPWLYQKYAGAIKNKSLRRCQDDCKVLLRAESLMKNRSLGPEGVLANACMQLAS